MPPSTPAPARRKRGRPAASSPNRVRRNAVNFSAEELEACDRLRDLAAANGFGGPGRASRADVFAWAICQQIVRLESQAG